MLKAYVLQVRCVRKDAVEIQLTAAFNAWAEKNTQLMVKHFFEPVRWEDDERLSCGSLTFIAEGNTGMYDIGNPVFRPVSPPRLPSRVPLESKSKQESFP